MPRKIRTNLDLVSDIMNYSPVGALSQAFVMEAIKRYADQCAAAHPTTFDSAMLNGAAWVACAKDIQRRFEEFYSR